MSLCLRCSFLSHLVVLQSSESELCRDLGCSFLSHLVVLQLQIMETRKEARCSFLSHLVVLQSPSGESLFYKDSPLYLCSKNTFKTAKVGLH